MESSSFGRVIGALVSPGKTFRSIAERPTWVVALLVLMAAALAASLVISPRVDWVEAIQQGAQGREIPADQLDMAVQVTKIITLVSPLIFLPLGVLFVALVMWMAFKVVGGELTYKTSLATTAHGFLPSVVGSLIGIIVVLGRGSVDLQQLQSNTLVASNLAVLAPEDSGAALVALLSSLDFFSLWALVLFIIGYKAAARVSTGMATGVVVSLWVVWVLVKVGLASLSGLFGAGA